MIKDLNKNRTQWEKDVKIGLEAWNRVDKSIFTEKVRKFMTAALENADFEETV